MNLKKYLRRKWKLIKPKSDSKSKYVATCLRETVLLTLGSDRKQAPDGNAPKRKYKYQKIDFWL